MTAKICLSNAVSRKILVTSLKGFYSASNPITVIVFLETIIVLHNAADMLLCIYPVLLHRIILKRYISKDSNFNKLNFYCFIQVS